MVIKLFTRRLMHNNEAARKENNEKMAASRPASVMNHIVRGWNIWNLPGRTTGARIAVTIHDRESEDVLMLTLSHGRLEGEIL